MSNRSNSSRERILECAQAIILQKGFSSTSIEDILEKASITKGGFFYHFDSKLGLAKALVERYLIQDGLIFHSLFQQADNLSENPLHQLLIFLKLLAETMGQLQDTHPGCLVASFTYESHQVDDDIRGLIRQGLVSWRDMISQRLQNVVDRYPPQQAIDIHVVANMFTSTIEGGIILSRAFANNQYLVDQILAYRDYLRRLFEA